MCLTIDGIGFDSDDAPTNGPIERANREIVGSGCANVNEYSAVPNTREESPTDDFVYVAFSSVLSVRH
jgi:hypothetical protein